MGLRLPIYLDYAASTPCEPRAVEAMLPFFGELFANASSSEHAPGVRAAEAVEAARAQAAELIGSLPQEIVWTSGATEANHLAIVGAARAQRSSVSSRGAHIVTAAHEHKSVLAPCRTLQGEGFEVTFLKPGPGGAVTASMVEEALRQETFLVSIMWANNELGTIHDIPGIGALCRRRGVLFHSDATQWVGKMPIRTLSEHLDLMSWSSHKVYGPKGVGALFVRGQRPPIRLEPLLQGGGQERGWRAGSPNVPGIVGFGTACDLCRGRMEEDASRLGSMRDRLERRLLEGAEGAVVNGASAARLPHISSITFPLAGGRPLVEELTDVACSSGSACGSADLRPSHVLRSLGLPAQRARNTLRLSLGRPTTEEQIEHAASHILEVLARLPR